MLYHNMKTLDTKLLERFQTLTVAYKNFKFTFINLDMAVKGYLRKFLMQSWKENEMKLAKADLESFQEML